MEIKIITSGDVDIRCSRCNSALTVSITDAWIDGETQTIKVAPCTNCIMEHIEDFSGRVMSSIKGEDSNNCDT